MGLLVILACVAIRVDTLLGMIAILLLIPINLILYYKYRRW
jgi:hypothetical protein